MQERQGSLFSRRAILRFGLGAIGALTLAGGAVRWLFWERLRSFYKRVAFPALDPDPSGRLDADTLEALRATTETLLGVPPQTRYLEFFRWHAENVKGYRAIYQGFARHVEGEAQRRCKGRFVDCESGIRTAILSEVMDQRVHPKIGTELTRFWRGARHRRLVQFDTYILQEILNLYARTDALLAVGYEAYPGVPTGLEDYRRAPAGL